MKNLNIRSLNQASKLLFVTFPDATPFVSVQSVRYCHYTDKPHGRLETRYQASIVADGYGFSGNCMAGSEMKSLDAAVKDLITKVNAHKASRASVVPPTLPML